MVARAGTAVLVVPRGPQGNFAEWARATAGDVVVVEAAALAVGVGTAVLDLTAAGACVGLGAALPGHAGLEGRLPGRTVVDARAADHTGSGRTLFERVRATKSAVELALLRRAQEAADAGMAAFWAAVRPGARNTAIQSLAREAAIAADADDALVIMNAGNDPWMWWTFQGDRRIPDRGVVSVEVNARVAGHCAQLARTGMVGEPDAVQSRLLPAGDLSVEAMVKVIGVADQTVARRYHRLRSAGLLRVRGLLEASRTGRTQLIVRIRCTPGHRGDPRRCAGPAL